MTRSNLLMATRKDKLFWFILLALAVFFAFIIYLGGTQVYQREVDLTDSNEEGLLNSTSEGIKASLSHVYHDLLFISALPVTQDYLSNVQSPEYRAELDNTLSQFISSYHQYHALSVVSLSGQELLKIMQTPDGIWLGTDSELRSVAQESFFNDVLSLGKGEVYVSPISLPCETDSTTTIRLSLLLFAANGKPEGVLSLEMNMEEILQLLPGSVFIQTEGGDALSLLSDGTVKVDKSTYLFNGLVGELQLSKTTALHYAAVEFLPGHSFMIVARHDHAPLILQLRTLVLYGIAVLMVCFLLLLRIGNINIARDKKLLDAQKAIISSLAGLTEWRDPDTGYHLDRTRDYALVLARQLQRNRKYRKLINHEFLENLYVAAPLHDMGKVAIPDTILFKPGSLTAEEYDQMKRHVLVGQDLLQKVIVRHRLEQSFLIMCQNICAYHHEKYDGTGYLKGLHGEQIPLEARIFALCDAYDAIRSTRPYKQDLPHKEAIGRIRVDSGKHFDPDIVAAFLQCETQFSTISRAAVSP